jgi:hypothetical protein
MKIDAQYGADTGMALVDVYLETEGECSLGAEGIWRELRPLLASAGVPLADVVDCFLHKRGPQGEWVSAGMLPWGGE